MTASESSSQRIAVLAQQVIGEILQSLAQAEREELLRRVAALVEGEVARERQRCIRLCLHRGELWKKTSSARPPLPQAAREEARARQNEAKYLADLIEQDQDLFGEPDV